MQKRGQFKRPYKPFKRNNNRSFGDRRPFRREEDTGPRRNHQIRAQEVLLIDENNEKLGVVPIQVAMVKAREAELDLVEVAAFATPPVCRILDYSKYKYEQQKKEQQTKKTGKMKPMKEFRFTPVIGIGDIMQRVKRAKEFLEIGHQVRITMFTKGRYSQEQSVGKFNEILTNFAEYSTIEDSPKREGRMLFVTYKPNGKTKNEQDSSQTIQAD